MKKILLLLALVFSSFGCGLFELENQQTNQDSQVQNKEVTTVQNEIKDALKDASKEDCETIYKVFMGCANYLENTERLDKFSDVLSLIGKVEEDYNWKTDTYSKLSDVVENKLKEKDYSEDFQINSKEKRAEVVAVFKEMADGVLLALKEKDANSK